MFVERRKRSVAKAISWRVLATITTMAIVYIFVGKFDLMLFVGGLDIVIKIILYYYHERIWDAMLWGRSRKKP